MVGFVFFTMSLLFEMVTDALTEAVYQRFLRNITSSGRETDRGVVSSPPPLSPQIVFISIDSTYPNAATFLRKGLQSTTAAIQN